MIQNSRNWAFLTFSSSTSGVSVCYRNWFLFKWIWEVTHREGSLYQLYRYIFLPLCYPHNWKSFTALDEMLHTRPEDGLMNMWLWSRSSWLLFASEIYSPLWLRSDVSPVCLLPTLPPVCCTCVTQETGLLLITVLCESHRGWAQTLVHWHHKLFAWGHKWVIKARTELKPTCLYVRHVSVFGPKTFALVIPWLPASTVPLTPGVFSGITSV